MIATFFIIKRDKLFGEIFRPDERSGFTPLLREQNSKGVTPNLSLDYKEEPEATRRLNTISKRWM